MSGKGRSYSSALRDFLANEALGGILLIAAAALAMIAANSPLASAYFHALHLETGPVLAPAIGPMTVHLWINDALMALFFLLVGLEIKREFSEGELGQLMGSLKRTVEQWKSDLVLGALRDVVMREVQAAENAAWQVKLSKFLDDAFGESLNVLGRIVGEGRDGRDDPSYRVRIRARIKVNSSFGTADDILEMLALLDDATFYYTSTPPAAFIIGMSAPPSGFASATEMAGLIGECAAAGVGGLLVMPTDTPGDGGFIFGDEAFGDPVTTIGDFFGALDTPAIPDGRFT